MTTLFTLLESGVELRSELPSAEDCDDMVARWELNYPDGGVLMMDAYDDQGHTMVAAVRVKDIRMMRYVPDDDPLLVQERAVEALRAQYDEDHPAVDAEIAEVHVVDAEAAEVPPSDEDDGSWDVRGDDDGPEDDDHDGELSLEGDSGVVG